MHIQINRSYKTESMLEEPRNERCFLLLCLIFDVVHHLACLVYNGNFVKFREIIIFSFKQNWEMHVPV